MLGAFLLGAGLSGLVFLAVLWRWSKTRDVVEDGLRRELEFRREQARFEGLDKRLTQVLRR